MTVVLFTATTARDVRVDVATPTQGADTYAGIYELEFGMLVAAGANQGDTPGKP
ncbi:hypothetical protein [Actinokineospora iranica]|uniref:hypothetical protein n=1 Tax=Actinokineospora iranica TaxID=1271860 RepID=UPI0015879E2D|nr:hypothetical protein [Actinokineospora iranica]